MDNFVFYNPVKVIFGRSTIHTIGKEINRSGIKKVLILAGGGSIKKNTAYEQVIKTLENFEIEWKEFWGVRPNPSLKHAIEAIEICKLQNIEAILAVGGGSVIDEAKAIAAGFYLTDLWKAFEGKAVIKKALPVFTVLTISGTCSEMNPFAVVTNDKEQKKWPVASPALFPKASVIDPEIQASLPWHQTVNGGIDALSHIMEFYFIGTDEEVVISGNESLMKTIIKSLDKLQINGRDYSARANLAWSATLALNGISGAAMKGGDWAVHQIEHGLSAINPEIAHGAGLAVLFPAWIKFSQKRNPTQFERWAKNVWNAASVEKGIENMKTKFSEWQAPVSLKELGFFEKDIDKITSVIMAKGDVGAYKLEENEIKDILYLAL